MIITKIELKNITTHKKTIIEFQRGLNLLFGNNGTGKSTVLNMIGYVLFNYLPSKKENYIRQAKFGDRKHGSIKVWVVGIDDELYIIERSLAKSNPIVQVKYGYTDLIVSGVNNRSDLEEWVKGQLDLNPETNLSDLFKTSIGVPQGTFTQPFLESSQNRKDFFNPILKVDVYRKIWKKFLNIIKEIDNDLVELNNKRTELETRLEPLDELKNQKKDYNSKLKDSQKELINSKKELEELNKKFKDYKKLDGDLKEKKVLKDQLFRQKKELLENIQSTKLKVKKVKNAEEICSSTIKDFEEYERSLKDEKNLRKLNEELTVLNKKINVSNQILTQLMSNKEENKKQIIEIKQHQKIFSQLKGNYESYQKLQERIQELRDKSSKINVFESNLDTKKTENVAITIKINEMEKKSDNYLKLKEKIDILEKKKEEKHKLELEINSMETKINQIEQNKNESKEGICPILNEQCLNIGDNSFEDIFQKKLDKINQEFKPKLRNLNEIDKELAKYDFLKEEIDLIEEIKAELNIYKERKLEIGRNIKKLVEKVKEKQSIEIKLKEYNNKSIKIEPDTKRYTVIKEKIHIDLPKLEKNTEEIDEEISPIQKKLKPLNDRIKELEEIPEKLKIINKKLERLKGNHDKYLSNKDIAETSQDLKSELKNIEDKHEKLERIYQSNLAEIKKIENLYNKDEMDKLEIEISKKKENKGRLLSLNQEYKKRVDEILDKLEELKDIENNLQKNLKKISVINFIKNISEKIRSYFNIAGPKITKTLLKHINAEATNHYRSIMEDPNVILTWEEDFLIKIKTNQNEKEFTQLSGGEQMTAALAVRLAILNVLSNAEFAFFDEPTMNLDPERRENLAKIIPRIKGFKQLFLITHDDTFEENVDNVIKFTKDDNEITQVECFTKN
ncbi:MAG: SMC family ATPase [Candidatus Lokiarchaeota archaeon]|nr:SMC family ATPase [Candidatus Lokiarchaeota archaeon]